MDSSHKYVSSFHDSTKLRKPTLILLGNSRSPHLQTGRHGGLAGLKAIPKEEDMCVWEMNIIDDLGVGFLVKVKMNNLVSSAFHC